MEDRASRCAGTEAYFWIRVPIALLAVASSLSAQIPGYGGPGIATRGARQAGTRGSESVSIRPYAGISGIADSGLTAVSLNEQGEIVNPGRLYGVEANVGAYGTKTWRRSQLGLDYQGNYRHYSRQTFYNGSDHLLNLSFGRQLSRTTAFSLTTLAGTTSRSIGGTYGLGLIDPTLLGNTFTDLFDNRAYFFNVSGGLTTVFGGRNQVQFSGGAFAVRRQSKALVGMNGQMATGTYARQVNRRTSVGLVYAFFHVDYPRVFGEADAHTLMLQVSRQIGRSWSIDLGGGAFLSDFAGVRVVAVDPVIAELFGTTTGREAFNTVNVSSAFQIRIARSRRRSQFSAGYSRGANPGNGVLLINRMESATVNYTYNSGLKWSFSGYGGYISQTGAGSYSGSYSIYNGGIMAGRSIGRDFSFNTGVDVRQTTFTTDSRFRRNGTRIFAGIVYSPGPIPVSLR